VRGRKTKTGENQTRWQVMPERFAQEALGHNSKAVHRAYAKRAIDENSVSRGLRTAGSVI
jgi:hypothetical protein